MTQKEAPQTITFRHTDALDEYTRRWKPKTEAFAGKCIADDGFPQTPNADQVELSVKQEGEEAVANKVNEFSTQENTNLSQQASIQIGAQIPSQTLSGFQRKLRDLLGDMKFRFTNAKEKFLLSKAEKERLREKHSIGREPIASKLPERFMHAIAFLGVEIGVTTIIQMAGGIALFKALGYSAGISIINVILFGTIACGLIMPYARKANGGKLAPVALIAAGLLGVFSIGTNALLAHVRSNADNMSAAIADFQRNPILFSDTGGFTIFGLGLVIALGWGYLMYSSRDPFLAYGEAGDRLKEAQDEMDHFSGVCRQDAADFANDAETEINAAETNGQSGLERSAKLLHAAPGLWKECIEQITLIVGFYERVATYHRQTVQRMLGKDVPEFYSEEPDFSNLIKEQTVDPAFQTNFDRHQTEAKTLHSEASEARKEMQASYDLFLKELSFDVEGQDNDEE